MSTSAELFYRKLQTAADIEALIGQPEDANFDCKEWPSNTERIRGSIAKAACAFTNATGGVIIIGVKASGRGAENPDVVQGTAAVADVEQTTAIALDFILKFVEPGIEGLDVRKILDGKSKSSGFVLLFVPAMEGAPRRSKVDWRFYVRIASGTRPMEHFEIEERFGRRPRPKLIFQIEPEEMISGSSGFDFPHRTLLFGLENIGRGIARFSSLRFVKPEKLYLDEHGLDGKGGFGIPNRPSQPNSITFRGGVDDVIYPGERRMIGRLVQPAVKVREYITQQQIFIDADLGYAGETVWTCGEKPINVEISGEGIATTEVSFLVKEASMTLPFRRRHGEFRSSNSSWMS